MENIKRAAKKIQSLLGLDLQRIKSQSALAVRIGIRGSIFVATVIELWQLTH